MLFLSRRLRVRELPSVASALRDDLTGSTVRVQGWVTAVRKLKGAKFLSLSDGLSPVKLQVVLTKELRDTSGVGHGSAVTVDGSIVASPGGMQSVELLATHITSHADTIQGPIMPKTAYSSVFLRRYAHLRPKTNSFAALLRTRNSLTMAIHKFFQDREFINITTPAITTNDCEGAGETFRVTSRLKPGSEETEAVEKEETLSESEQMVAEEEDARRSLDTNEFFGQPASLTTSGQLHLEAMANALKAVYCISPAFRAEATIRRFHMAEFTMLEAEVAFLHSLDPLLNIVEDLVRQTACVLLERCGADVAILDRFHHNGKTAYLQEFNRKLSEPFPRIRFEDAANLLNSMPGKDFRFKVREDLKKEHEWALVQHFGNRPVFVTHYPSKAKPFYCKRTDCGQWAESFDLLSPIVGEICSGSLREDNYQVLRDRCEPAGNTQLLHW